MAKKYLENGGLSVWFKNGKKFAQSSGDQFKDLRNEEIDPSPEMAEIYWKLFKNIPQGYSGRLKSYEEQKEFDGEKALDYAIRRIGGRFSQAEHLFANKAFLASEYARKALNGRFPEGERIIATEPRLAVDYALRFLKGRWPEAEKFISESPISSLEYAEKVIKGPWAEGENAIAQDSRSAINYATKILKGRFEKAEPHLADDAYYAVEYVEKVLKGRFPAAEKELFESGYASLKDGSISVWEQYVAILKKYGIPDPNEQSVVNKEFSPNG